MKKLIFKAVFLPAALASILSLAGCEYLFYSPAFMPVVSETELRVITPSDYQEFYDGEETAYGTWAYAGPGNPLEVSPPNTTGRDIPALRSLEFDNESWHGVSEFLGMFFDSANAVPLDGGSGSGATMFHGYSSSFTYNSYTASDYDLPFSAPEGINENGRTTSLSGDLAVVEISADGLKDELRGEGTFVFGNGPDNWGLLYMIFHHDSGQATMAYQTDESGSAASSYFPAGSYTYIINVFPD
ncbi:hypothetical protein B4O97_09255 [Marispirochaeta aestuarii]|uniref:Lipoprotein n=1 Tax=Marispirochaeta aestuarii TaxID=1963862 RepID=A0A1Y1RY16_9SPIO|nr:hypothetical protein [Marispirochaeta aestuarii]ORC35351.1 hypothetical protein B4O97_09255 [Marispirochaeta aestuarii]